MQVQYTCYVRGLALPSQHYGQENLCILGAASGPVRGRTVYKIMNLRKIQQHFPNVLVRGITNETFPNTF
jgi:hypothetical protein